MEKKLSSSAKRALLTVLARILEKNGGTVYFAGYENDEDRVQFSSEGHRCRLLELNGVSPEHGTVELTVLAKGVELKEWEVVTVNFVASGFRTETLARIAYEAYDIVKDEEDGEAEDFIEEALGYEEAEVKDFVLAKLYEVIID